MAFDPTKHLTNLGNKGDYLETKWRLVWLHADNPETPITITTKLEEHEIGKRAVFSAHVVVGNREATGWAIKEQRGNGPSYLENAETHALGRALAALGYGTQFCDDYADGNDADGVTPVDSPVPPRPRTPTRRESVDRSTGEITAPKPEASSPSETPTQSTNDDEPAAALDIQRLTHMWTVEAEQTEAALVKFARDRYGKALDALTAAQVTAITRQLAAKIEQRKATTKSA